MKPKIYADFQNLDDENRIRLNTVGTRNDLLRFGIQLTEGLDLLLFMDDGDESGQPDDLLVKGVAEFSAEENMWTARADWSSIHHASDEPSHLERNGQAATVAPAQKV